MGLIQFRYQNALPFLGGQEFECQLEDARKICTGILNDSEADAGVKGWVVPCEAAIQLDEMKQKAEEIRANADVFVLVGVGGSNQAARAAIKAIAKKGGPEIIYAGNTLSAHSLRGVLDQLEGKSVYINVIAKNFETLEPGSHYRVLRHWMKRHYGPEEMARRVVLTGTRGSRLHEIAKENGCLFLDFPERIGGRYSAFCPVGLLPMAVAGLDLDRLLAGVQAQYREIKENPDSTVVEYAALRSLLYRGGYNIELLASFEPRFEYFTKWWIQLFGESEGKDGKGTFPAAAIYSEDLHSMGQYLQDGRRGLLETFLTVSDPETSVIVEPDPSFGDHFDYLDGMDFTEINRVAQSATIDAHSRGGVPCVELECERIDEYAFGQLFYFFMMACAISGKLLGVNPFDQEGVEEYKRSMFRSLGKS